MTKINLKHIDALSKGKKSGIKIGSRGIPHHLYLYEREEYERALKRGYLIKDITFRENLENIWHLVSQSKNQECIILYKNHDTGIVRVNGNIIFEGLLREAKEFLKKDNIV